MWLSNAEAKLQPSHNKSGSERSEPPRLRRVGCQLQRTLDGTFGQLFEDQQKRIASVGTAPRGKLQEGIML